jgi:hypothetical protein
MKHQRSHGVTGVTWFCEVPPSPTSLISIYPHPIRLVTPPPPPLPCIRRSSHAFRGPPTRQFFLLALPTTPDRGGYLHGGGADGEGAESPLPCLYFQYAHIPHPCTSSFLRLFPLHWTVGGIATGEGQTGRGQKPPSPVSTFNMLTSPTPAPVLSSDSSHYTGPWGVSPRGRGRRGGGRKPPPLSLLPACRYPPPTHQFFPQTLPITLDRGGYPHGDGADGEGAETPSPVSASNMLASPTPPSLRPPPPPREGRGQSWRYPGKGRIRGVSPLHRTVGVSPRGRGRRGGGRNPLPCLYFQYAHIPHPCTSSFLRLFPLHRTVGGIPTGEGQTGRGQKAPSPVSASNMPASPTPPSLRLLPHASSFFWLSPLHWTVGGIATGEGQTGRGQKAPSPVSASNMPASPTPPGLWPPPPPLPRRGQSWRYPGKGRIRGVSPLHWTVGGGGRNPPPLSLLPTCRHPPPRPASGLLPAPGGAGAVMAIPQGKAISPLHWTVGGIATGKQKRLGSMGIHV